MEKIIELKPIKETTEDFEAAEKRIKELFKSELYYPLLAELQAPKTTLQNASENALVEAIRSGRVIFYRGTFSGRFSSQISKDLRSLGAVFDRRSGTYKIILTDLPMSLRSVIAASESRFLAKMTAIDKTLSDIVPEKLADKLSVADLFDRTLFKTQKSFEESVKGITVSPKLTTEQRAKIADEWQNNMRLWIKDFTEKEIKSLRAEMHKTIFSGARYETVVSKIQESYGVTARKAKFLARQETSLLMAKFQETQYVSAGVNEYRWGCVVGSPKHPVRPSHKKLENKVFRWDDPPITTMPGEPVRRNNPGQDYNCRCFARPIVKFKREEP